MSDTTQRACQALLTDPQFIALVRQRRRVAWRLFAVSMAFFFSVPLVSGFAPGFFAVRLGGGANIGLCYLIAQYLVGGAVAWRYAVQLRRLDALAEALRSAAPVRPAGADAAMTATVPA
ncbi:MULTISPECIES: DUF485 domain-containing protein [Cupriavidus]